MAGDMFDTKLYNITKQILERGYLLSLATVDAEGVWVADVIYTFDDDLNIYWMSKPWRRHSRAIEEEKNFVAGTITLTAGPNDPEASLQISGTAESVMEIPWKSVLTFFYKRQKPEPKQEEDFLGEHRWYKLVPNHIELIDGDSFGYDRQRVL